MLKGLLAALCAAAVAVPATAAAAPNNNNSPKLREAVPWTASASTWRRSRRSPRPTAATAWPVRPGMTPRRSTSPTLERGGLEPGFHEFSYTYTGSRTPAILAVSGGTSYAVGFQFELPTSLGPADSKDVTAPLTAVDLKVPSPGGVNGSTSGCESADFAGFPAGSIALIQRGTSTSW